jgi:hypothetical protein
MQSIQQSAPCFEPDVPAVYSLHSDTTRSLHGAAVHANQVRSFDVLAARFPVIRRLVGEMSFRIVARRFILREPPDVRTPSGYGENFPRFLRSHGRAASIEYVADIAELEMVRGRAQHAPDARPLPASSLSSLLARRTDELLVVLHPSVFLVQSRFPIVTIWENTRDDDGSVMFERWGAEAALVSRPFLEVEIRRLPPGGYAFLRALSEGQTVAIAARIASEGTPKFELASNLTLLIDANVVIGVREAASPFGQRGERCMPAGTVGVVGAGTMGSGIARAAKLGGRKEEDATDATAGAER